VGGTQHTHDVSGYIGEFIKDFQKPRAENLSTEDPWGTTIELGKFRDFRELQRLDRGKNLNAALEQYAGMTLQEFYNLYCPQGAPNPINIHFCTADTIVFEEIRAGKKPIQELLLGKVAQSNPHLKNRIHPAIKYLFDNRTTEQPPNIVVSGIPSTFDELQALQLLDQYLAMGVPAENIKILRGSMTDEEKISLIEGGDYFDFCGGDQSKLVNQFSSNVSDALRARLMQQDTALITTSASCAALGAYMLTGGGSYDDTRNPFIIAVSQRDNSEVYVNDGLGILHLIVTDTHLSARPRENRFLAFLAFALLKSKLHGITDKRGIGCAEGAFAVLEQGTLKVFRSDENTEGEGVLYIDTSKLKIDMQQLTPGVYELKSVQAKNRTTQQWEELIYQNREKSGARISIDPNHRIELDDGSPDTWYNKWEGIYGLCHGEELNLHIHTVEKTLISFEQQQRQSR